MNKTSSVSSSTSPAQNRQRTALAPQQADDAGSILHLISTFPIHAAMPQPFRLLVCSIGNPSPYLNTLHSAGHTVIAAIQASLSYPAFTKSRSYGNGLVSSGPEFTLFQSPSLMNVSGVPIAAAWRAFQSAPASQTDMPPALIVIHDELELPLGTIKVRSGSASPKGHNGLKSIREKMPSVAYTRIGVGIGRPESREPDAVARYVLRKMMPGERAKIEAVAAKVEGELRRLAGVA